MLSQMEGIAKGVPMLVMPGFGDQPNNGKRAERMNFGKKLDWPDVNEESF